MPSLTQDTVVKVVEEKGVRFFVFLQNSPTVCPRIRCVVNINRFLREMTIKRQAIPVSAIAVPLVVGLPTGRPAFAGYLYAVVHNALDGIDPADGSGANVFLKKFFAIDL